MARIDPDEVRDHLLDAAEGLADVDQSRVARVRAALEDMLDHSLSKGPEGLPSDAQGSGRTPSGGGGS